MGRKEIADVPVDAVIYWVDGNDPQWQKEYMKYRYGEDNESNRASRFRDWDNLQYIFRGIETYMPWINNVFFVTCGHVPEWLNCEHPKLKLVKHSDYMPTEYLPTFSSCAIELNFHRIEELSEHFVVINDDCFVTNHVKKSDFFVDGKPRDIFMEYPVMCGGNVPAFSQSLCNNNNFIGKYYKRSEYKKRLRRQILSPKYGMYFFYNLIQYVMPYPHFFGLLTPHFSLPYLKSAFAEMWQAEEAELDIVSKQRFRDRNGMNIYIARMWNLLKGNFVPGNLLKQGKMLVVTEDDEKIYQTIEKQKYKLICLNDECIDKDFEAVKEKVKNSFEKILPKKSGFEK